MAVLTTEERDALVAQALDAREQRYPPEGDVSDDEFHRLNELFYVSVADYFDGLPRPVMSACPFCGEPFSHSFDPWGVDGIWWGEDKIFKMSEPPTCEHFQVLLGALKIEEGSVPARIMMRGEPGPGVPYVVPQLLERENMIAVVGKLEMQRGGPAYPIAYFSDQKFDPAQLHPKWRRTVMWYSRGGDPLWGVRTSPWDFDLAPWIARGKLRWVLLDPETPEPVVRGGDEDETCPFLDLPGDRFRQVTVPGDRLLMPVPDGTPPNPFEEGSGA